MGEFDHTTGPRRYDPAMRVDLEGRRAFVTGASRGIGAAIAAALEDAGAQVYAGYRERADVPRGEAFHC